MFSPELIILFVISILLVWLSTKRVLEAVILFPAGPGLETVREGGAISNEELDYIIERLLMAADTSAHYNIYNKLGHLQGMKVQQYALGDAQREVLIETAIQNISKGIALAPASPYPWFRFTQLELLKGDYKKAALGLKQSYLNGIFDKRLFVPRLNAALILYRHLDQEGIDITVRQITLGMENNPKEIAQLAWGNRDLLPAITESLAGNQELLKSFNSIYNPFQKENR